mmetsp:Transcript_128352/g.411353  ORF Transcript_128352/g.411353 Transcript_128352/m.411353 type:complete len:214 (+) Transcript_128352:100-741(+)
MLVANGLRGLVARRACPLVSAAAAAAATSPSAVAAAAAVSSQRRFFARRSGRLPPVVPVALQLVGVPTDTSMFQGPPMPAPRQGGYPLPRVHQPRGGAMPRLASLRLPGIGGCHSPFEDPGAPPAGEPLEPERPPPPWKVLRTHNGNLPVYTRIRYGGSDASTQVRHFFGDIENMKKELASLCESPVRTRPGRFEVRGLHTWKIKEWLVSLGM